MEATEGIFDKGVMTFRDVFGPDHCISRYKGVETEWFRGRKPEDMYRTSQDTHAHGRHGLG